MLAGCLLDVGRFLADRQARLADDRTGTHLPALPRRRRGADERVGRRRSRIYPVTVYPVTIYPVTIYPVTVYPVTIYPVTIYPVSRAGLGIRLPVLGRQCLVGHESGGATTGVVRELATGGEERIERVGSRPTGGKQKRTNLLLRGVCPCGGGIDEDFAGVTSSRRSRRPHVSSRYVEICHARLRSPFSIDRVHRPTRNSPAA